MWTHIHTLQKKKKLGDSVPKHLSGRIGSFQQRQQESELLGNVDFLRRAEQMLQSSHTCLLFRSRSWKGLTPAICMSQNQCYVRVEPKLVYVLRAQFSLKTLKVKFNPQRAVYSNPCLSQIQFLLEKKKKPISQKKSKSITWHMRCLVWAAGSMPSKSNENVLIRGSHAAG